MMLTPLDIHEREFKRAFRGYSEVEVDEFLDQVVREFEQLLKENSDLRSELEKAQEEVARYRRIEDTLQNTLLMAQRTAEDLQVAARKEADLIIKEAQSKQREIEESTRGLSQKLSGELERLNRAHAAFLGKMKACAITYLTEIEAEERQREGRSDGVQELIEPDESSNGPGLGLVQGGV